MRKLLSIFAFMLLTACTSPYEGPDKTIAGAALGAAWGAGAGAVVGNNLEWPGRPGEGAAVGAGFGLVGGALNGAMFDSIENTQLTQEKELAALKIRNYANGQQLANMQATLDQRLSSTAGLNGMVYQVYFDVDETNLRAGSIANLEVIAENLKARTNGMMIKVIGHTDDTGRPDYNERLAEARARSVSSYLMARGLSADQMEVDSFGAKRPIASNTSETGRQLNRRVDIYVNN
ncbi:MAG: OmpA family protein [Bdellovibrionales bacterium]|nr:OmpA family protein [Bdellovibrionales bacterium]